MGQIELQKSISQFEDKGFNKTHAEIKAENPVFITSLPRAGTTLLLDLISGTPDFVSHTYRDMPFVLCPLTWNKVSQRFRKPPVEYERAHGDGMTISYDSVEAFEEILWLAFWPEHFESNLIQPWTSDEMDEDGQFKDFFRQHMRKMVALGQMRKQPYSPRRYVSKNNANVARLAWLQRQFPDATILIPYRNPMAHLASLANQHMNFLSAHDANGFSLKYMESIGHFEFGKAIRPINFNNWLDGTLGSDPANLSYWAEYWIVTFEALLKSAGSIVKFLSYDRLCADPDRGLIALENHIGLNSGSLAEFSCRLRPPNAYAQTMSQIDDRISRRIESVVSKLDERAVF